MRASVFTLLYESSAGHNRAGVASPIHAKSGDNAHTMPVHMAAIIRNVPRVPYQRRVLVGFYGIFQLQTGCGYDRLEVSMANGLKVGSVSVLLARIGYDDLVQLHTDYD